MLHRKRSACMASFCHWRSQTSRRLFCPRGLIARLFTACEFLNDALSQIGLGHLAGAHFSFVFRDAWPERMDVPTKLRLALSRYLEPSLAARQSLPLLAAGLWDCLYSGVHAAVCRIFAPEFGNRFAVRSACNQQSFGSGRYRAALHVLCRPTTHARRLGNSAAA